MPDYCGGTVLHKQLVGNQSTFSGCFCDWFLCRSAVPAEILNQVFTTASAATIGGLWNDLAICEKPLCHSTHERRRQGCRHAIDLPVINPRNNNDQCLESLPQWVDKQVFCLRSACPASAPGAPHNPARASGNPRQRDGRQPQIRLRNKKEEPPGRSSQGTTGFEHLRHILVPLSPESLCTKKDSTARYRTTDL